MTVSPEVMPYLDRIPPPSPGATSWLPGHFLVALLGISCTMFWIDRFQPQSSAPRH